MGSTLLTLSQQQRTSSLAFAAVPPCAAQYAAYATRYPYPTVKRDTGGFAVLSKSLLW